MNSLTWKKTGDAYYLASPAEELVKLQFEDTDRAIFWMSNEIYEVKRSGFWNQRYTVLRDSQEMVSVSHTFWGSQGKLRFVDGARYDCDYNYKNTLTLRFLDTGSEILSYYVGKGGGKPQAIINLGIALVDAERLVILATLGMVMFLNIFNEFKEDDGSLLTMVAAS
jgi:hypothetical protein